MPVAGVNHHFGYLDFSWLMFLLLIWIGGSSPDPCAYLSTPNKDGNTPRSAGDLLPSTVTLTALDDKGVEITHDKISFCRIKNDKYCMQGFDSSPPFQWPTPAYEAFLQMLQVTLGIPPLERKPKSYDYAGHLDDLFKGITCEEGFCGADNKCAPCSSCAKDYVRYQTVQRGVRRVNTDKVLLSKLFEIDECGRIRGEEKEYGYRKPEKFQLSRQVARIQINKDGPVFLIEHCLVPDDETCLPQTTREFELLKERLLAARVVDSSWLNPGDLDNSPWNENKSLAFKSWNCVSGVCDPKTLKCRRSRFPRRKYRIWRVYEYMNTSSVGVPTFRASADGMHIYLLFGYTGLILSSTYICIPSLFILRHY